MRHVQTRQRLQPQHASFLSAIPFPSLPLLPVARPHRAGGGICYAACADGQACDNHISILLPLPVSSCPSLCLPAPPCVFLPLPVSSCPFPLLSELLEAYAACADGAEVIAAQHRWMEREAELAQARHAGTDVPSPGSSRSDSEGSDSDDDAAPLFRNPNHGAGWGRGGRGGEEEDEDDEEDEEEDEEEEGDDEDRDGREEGKDKGGKIEGKGEGPGESTKQRQWGRGTGGRRR
ncbi:unnamed protein product [Closterium sp. NIES-53]